MIFNQKSKTPF